MRKRYHGANFDYKAIDVAKEYTPRQIAILNEEIPLEDVSLNELTRLRAKATARMDYENILSAKSLQEQKRNPYDKYSKPKYTLEEAREILQRLTPYPIDWDKLASSK